MDWFVRNAADGNWLRNEAFGARCVFDEQGDRFPQLGLTLAVLEPGKPSGLYHAESGQEDFLVLDGECLLVVEGEERPLSRWDFVHCPPGTEHVFVGAGGGPCVLLMAGARFPGKTIRYPVEPAAARHGGASVERETDSQAEAYAPLPRWLPAAPLPL